MTAMKLPRWYTRTFGGPFPMRQRVWIAIRHSAAARALFLLAFLLAAATVGLIVADHGLWWLLLTSGGAEVVILEAAWRKGAI